MPVFDVSFLNLKIGCVPGENSDPETNCRACGDNARLVYEQCRQSFFLKKQNELTSLVQQTAINSANEKIKNLEKLVEGQNGQIKELIESSQQDIKMMEELKNSLQHSYLLSIVLGLMLVGLVAFLFIRKFKK